MQRIVEGYFGLLKILIVLCLAVMVVLVFGNVVLRYGFNSGITVSEELSRWCFVWLTFLGAILGMHEHTHLGVDLVIKHLPALGKRICLILGHLLMLYATWLFLQGSWQQTLINLRVGAPATGLSMGLFYGVGIIFGVPTGLILLYELVHAISGQVTEVELVGIRQTEDDTELEDLQQELSAEKQGQSVLDSAKKPMGSTKP